MYICVLNFFNFIYIMQRNEEIHENNGTEISCTTPKRLLSKFISDNLVEAGKRKYSFAPTDSPFHDIYIDSYFQKEIDERTIQENINFGLLGILHRNLNLFTEEASDCLEKLQQTFRINTLHFAVKTYF